MYSFFFLGEPVCLCTYQDAITSTPVPVAAARVTDRTSPAGLVARDSAGCGRREEEQGRRGLEGRLAHGHVWDGYAGGEDEDETREDGGEVEGEHGW